MAKGLSKSRYTPASREALLRYCELDTWAMVKVWEKLKATNYFFI